MNVKNCHHYEKTQFSFYFLNENGNGVHRMRTQTCKISCYAFATKLVCSFEKPKISWSQKNVLRSCHINQTMTNQIQTFRIFVVDVKSCDLSNFLCFFLYSDIPIVCRWKLVSGLVYVKYPDKQQFCIWVLWFGVLFIENWVTDLDKKNKEKNAHRRFTVFK